MSNGREWHAEHTETLKAMRGRPDAEIAALTGHSVRTIRERRRALGYAAFPNREHWTRRDWLLNDASGLDFQMSL
jgi:hypothetical protein